MQIPDTIKIGWRDYCIEFVDEIDEDLSNGEISFNEQKIKINKNIKSIDEKSFTLLHEIIHGIFYSQGHSEWNDNEDLVDAVSEGLFQVLKDNPELFKN
jgi:Zn-dependent peptidase ImmA (M78 family)